MQGDLENVTLFFCETNGDAIMSYNINGTISALVPMEGDRVSVDGTFREVTQRAFMYLPNTKTIHVSIYLKDL